MVFYRKYRPQTIEELDSEEVRNRLASVLSKDNAHALLFTGPKGLGKTSTARIVAKIVNCENLTEKDRKSGKLEPCNKCDQCVSTTNGNNIDILEIDGASNRGIDEIRDLREKVRLSPARARKKVYIIDEVHMLTTEAFNALLKTLEEPPEHVVFMLCTTEAHKVPATIASRCVQIAFKKATNEELLRAFQRIVEKENILSDKEALLEIAKFADGSFRDGVKVLEELAATAGNKKITKEFIQSTYQISNIDKQVEEMVSFFADKDTKKGIALIGELVESGMDIRYFLEQLIFRIHNIMLEKIGIEKEKSKIADRMELSEIKDLIEVLSEAFGKTKFSVLPQLPLEIAIIEWSVRDSDRALSHAEGDAHKDSSKSHDSTHSLSESQLQNNIKPEVKTAPPSSSPSDEKNTILIKLIDKIKVNNQQVAGVLRGCLVKEFKDDNLIIEAKFKFHKDKLEEKDTRDIIEKELKEIEGKDISVSFVLKS